VDTHRLSVLARSERTSVDAKVPPPPPPPSSPEVKREAVQLPRSSGRAIPQLAKELGVSPQPLRNRRAQIGVDEGVLRA